MERDAPAVAVDTDEVKQDMVAMCFHEGHVTKTEGDLLRFFNGLPDDLEPGT